MSSIFMEQAILEAKKGIEAGHGGPFGCVIEKQGKIIGVGHNRVLIDHDPTSHGEIVAIRDACKNLQSHDLQGCNLYTTAEPCPMCLGACLWANIDKIYYGCNRFDTENIGFRDNVFYEFLERQKDESSKKLLCLDHEDCLKLFAYYKSLEHKLY